MINYIISCCGSNPDDIVDPSRGQPPKAASVAQQAIQQMPAPPPASPLSPSHIQVEFPLEKTLMLTAAGSECDPSDTEALDAYRDSVLSRYAARSRPENPQQLSVLVVDDHSLQRLVVAGKLVREAGVLKENILAVSSGAEALSVLAFHDRTFDVIVMDYHMPFSPEAITLLTIPDGIDPKSLEWNGFNTARRIREWAGNGVLIVRHSTESVYPAAENHEGIFSACVEKGEAVRFIQNLYLTSRE